MSTTNMVMNMVVLREFQSGVGTCTILIVYVIIWTIKISKIKLLLVILGVLDGNVRKDLVA